MKHESEVRNNIHQDIINRHKQEEEEARHMGEREAEEEQMQRKRQLAHSKPLDEMSRQT